VFYVARESVTTPAFFGKVAYSAVQKSFGRLAFKLSQKEWVALLRHAWKDGLNMISDGSVIHGSCRHQAKFS
jgi:hypothetical protein